MSARLVTSRVVWVVGRQVFPAIWVLHVVQRWLCMRIPINGMFDRFRISILSVVPRPPAAAPRQPPRVCMSVCVPRAGRPCGRRDFSPFPLFLSPREFSIVPRYPSGVLDYPSGRKVGNLLPIYYPHAIILSQFIDANPNVRHTHGTPPELDHPQSAPSASAGSL